MPNFSPQVQEALEPVLKGEIIQLAKGSLVKLSKRQREEFLPLIRPTLESPNAVLDDGKGLLFIKEFINPDKTRYFMSVAKNYNGEWVFSTHIRKDFSGIKKKFADSKVLYNAGFSGGEVASASDILESGGTAIKPSDLQINTPPNHGSGLNPTPQDSTTALKLEAKEPPKLDPKLAPKFRLSPLENTQASYDMAGNKLHSVFHKGVIEVKREKILREKQQLFYDRLKRSYNLERHEGYYTPSNALENTPRLSQKALYEVHRSDYSKFLGLRDVLDSPSVVLKTQEGYLFAREEKWGVKTFVDLREDKEGLWHVAHFGDFKTFKKVDDALKQGGQMLLDQRGSKAIPANPAFGENFAEYAGKGAQAVAKLLKEKRGQVAGAFYKEGLGYIDLVWGAVKNKEGKIQGHGLSKIVEKHLDDFKEFAGKNAEEKLGNGIRDIIHNGEVVKTHNGYNILYQGYKVGLNEGWNEKGVKIGNNRWVVTAYDNSKSLASKSQGRNSDSLTKGETLPLNSKEDTTTTPLKTPQELAELQLEPEQIHDLLRERFSQRSIWDAKHTIANHPVLIEDGKKKIEIAQRGDLEEQARAISEKLSKAPRSQRQKLYEQLEANQDARDIDLHKRIIEGYEREIERAKKYLARYQKAQEF
ncbi:PBECR2 nuclease fold domain-containing protein, partial [Helicobacter sp. L8]|uniref:putative barnase/colicin E5 family endoribonuclease n=1 Tax=Helicobacter sp. L8 TaxID=2316078 RepID=UPI0023E4340C